MDREHLIPHRYLVPSLNLLTYLKILFSQVFPTMTTQKAIVVNSHKQASVVSDRPIPTLRDDYILIKNVSVALNPTDWKHVAYLAPPGVVIGVDYAGIVEAVGKNVKKNFQKGDRICGFVHGGNAVQPEDGAFAEYIVAKGDIQIHIPDNLSFQEAATLGVGIVTVGQALYQSLKLALPTEPIKQPVSILIYGGSTATGALAIQFAKLSGYNVLTTCSPRNFDLAKSLGADAVFDYNDPKSAAEIRKYTNNNLKLVLDTISLESSAAFCDQAISTEGGDYSALLPIHIERPNVNDRLTIAYTAVGEAFTFGDMSVPAKPEDRDFAEMFWGLTERLLAEGKVKVHKHRVLPGGLKGALEGLELLRLGKVSGEKLVCNVAETP
jgi:NADPH:quinone reductase-like Zn-dependent oxidoreductase